MYELYDKYTFSFIYSRFPIGLLTIQSLTVCKNGEGRCCLFYLVDDVNVYGEGEKYLIEKAHAFFVLNNEC